MRKVWIAGAAVLVSSSMPMTAQGQGWATDDDQQAIELAAAQRIMAASPIQPPSGMVERLGMQAQAQANASKAPVWVRANFVFEPRLFVLPPDGPRDEIVTSHSSAQLARLADLFQIKAVLDESKACAYKFGDVSCRYTGFDGYIQMGAAFIRDQKAELVVRMVRLSVNPKTGKTDASSTVYRCAGQRISGGWNISAGDAITM